MIPRGSCREDEVLRGADDANVIYLSIERLVMLSNNSAMSLQLQSLGLMCIVFDEIHTMHTQQQLRDYTARTYPCVV